MFNQRIILAARIILGLILVVFGLNKFFWFMPEFELTGQADVFFSALHSSGYMFPIIGAVEVFAGLTLLANRFIPLGLILQAPITVNFIAFHLFLDFTPNIGAGILVLILQVYLMFAHFEAFRPLLQAHHSSPISEDTLHLTPEPVVG